MRVEGTNGAHQQDLPGGKPAPGLSPPRPADVGAAGGGVEAGAAKTAHVQSALAADEIDLAAVAEARRLLQEGMLDTPEAALRAAQILIDRGP